jgi:hypothetical protein
MVEVLYAPDRERILTSNPWAFLHWLRTTREVELPDWAALLHWSAAYPAQFAAAVAAFARLPDRPVRLAGRDGGTAHAALDRPWPPSVLIRPLADLLLHADLRRDDRLLVIGPAWPWLAAMHEGTAMILSAANDALAAAAAERASVLVVSAQTLAKAAFRRQRRPDLASLRTIVATGGPLSPEARRRVYIWIKSDVMLLARTGDTYWGNPLEPVLARPPATPAFLTPPVSVPAIL